MLFRTGREARRRRGTAAAVVAAAVAAAETKLGIEGGATF